jgi:hypothetical protein
MTSSHKPWPPQEAGSLSLPVTSWEAATVCQLWDQSMAIWESVKLLGFDLAQSQSSINIHCHLSITSTNVQMQTKFPKATFYCYINLPGKDSIPSSLRIWKPYPPTASKEELGASLPTSPSSQALSWSHVRRSHPHPQGRGWGKH